MERDKKQKLDSFWDISQLVPPKKKKEVAYGKRARLAEVTVKGAEHTEVTSENNKLHISQIPKEGAVKKQEVKIYEHLSPLMKRVEIHPLKSTYHYYEFFCKNAQAYYDIHGRECERVPFFSYVAQYSQMNQAQLDWYFWWRENVRKSVFIDTDISYIYLYIYEIINLGDLIDTEKALHSLIEIWHHYREIYPALNKALGEWICDYSLQNGIPIPFPNPLITRDMIDACSFGEAFYGFDPKDDRAVADFLVYCCGGYNYRKSKFYAEHQSLYDEVLPSCLARLSPFLAVWETNDEARCKHVSKVAFVGALCSYRIRKHIEVDYIPAASGDLKLLVTAVLKYTENMLRSSLGIRSRLAHAELTDNIKTEIGCYFTERFGERIVQRETVPEYEKLYEAKDEDFSLEKALDIERSSWSITEELIEEFEDTVSLETICSEKASGILDATEEVQDKDREDPLQVFLDEILEYKEFFEAVVSRDMALQRAFCREKGMFPESAFDFINEKAVDILGDILLEETDGGYEIIEDYKEMFETEEGYANP